MLASLSDDSIAPSDLLTLSPRLGESWREGPHQPRDCLARGARLITEPVPASLSRSCPRSFDCVRDAHSLRMTNQERWQAVRCLARDAPCAQDDGLLTLSPRLGESWREGPFSRAIAWRAAPA